MTPQGKEVVIPIGTKVSNVFQLTEVVKKQINQFDSETSAKYSEKPRMEAKSLGYDWYGYLRKVVENQICMRLQEPEKKCWLGLGDNLHGFAHKIDGKIEKLPRTAKKISERIVQAATKIATGTANKKLGGCTTCGGRKVFAPAKDNLGRKERLNKIG